MAGSKSYMQGAASIVNHKQYCVLCGKESNGLFGKFFSSLEVRLSVHQYCLFFASGLAQNGDDNEGFDGFLPEDILKEASRGKQLERVSISVMSHREDGNNITGKMVQHGVLR